MTTLAKAEFYWAIVGDANPEPVAVIIENGKRVAYTCGCADSFDVDGPNARIELIPLDFIDFKNDIVRPMPIPKKPDAHRELRDRHEAYLQKEAAAGRTHGHRRFNP